MEVSIDIDGLREMEKALLGLGAVLGAKTLRNALRDAAKPMHQEMISRAPVSSFARTVKNSRDQRVEIRPGFLKSRIKIRGSLNSKGLVNRKFKKDDVAVMRVGVFRVGYATQVEFGTTKARAQPFIRPALRRTEESLRIFQVRLAHRIELARKKAARQKAKG